MKDELTEKYLNRKEHRPRFMEGKNLDSQENEKGYRIRSTRDLLDQIKEDHNELNKIWDQFVKGTTSRDDKEECLRLISWLKEEFNAYKELRGKGIEGVLWGELEEIEKDVKDKEINFKILQ